MKYKVLYRDGLIICQDVDKDCAKTICQFLNFLVNAKLINISLADIKVCWTGPPCMTEQTLLSFIQN